MPREIKFRGKRIDNDDWVYGGVDIQSGDTCIFDHSCMLHSSCEVDAETVGEYAGIRDKNGKEIYEGDIVHLIERHYDNCSRRTLVSTDESTVLVVHRMHTFGVGDPNKQNIRPFLWIVTGDYEIEVIGNIYENPEFLEVEK